MILVTNLKHMKIHVQVGNYGRYVIINEQVSNYGSHCRLPVGSLKNLFC